MRISDWSSDLCSSELGVARAIGGGHDAYIIIAGGARRELLPRAGLVTVGPSGRHPTLDALWPGMRALHGREQQPGGRRGQQFPALQLRKRPDDGDRRRAVRSDEHTSELQSLMRISYAVFCLKKKTTYIKNN